MDRASRPSGRVTVGCVTREHAEYQANVTGLHGPSGAGSGCELVFLPGRGKFLSVGALRGPRQCALEKGHVFGQLAYTLPDRVYLAA